MEEHRYFYFCYHIHFPEKKKSLLVGIKTVTMCGMLSDVDVVQGVITRCDYSTRYTNKV